MWTNATNTNVVYANEISLDPIVKSITWSGEIAQGYRKLEVTISNTVDNVWQALTIEHGKELSFYNEGKELFRGVIFANSVDATGQMTITAYDENIYLTKNVDTKKFVNMTATAIIRELCTEFDIPAGPLTETDYLIPKLILRNKTLWDMMVTALTETRKQTGRRFFIFSQEGCLGLIERGEKIIEWVLENGVNITSATYSQNIEDMRTQVKVTGGNDENAISTLLADDDLIAKFGIMQHVEDTDSDRTPSQVEELAHTLLHDLGKISDETSVEALGIDDVIAGTAVYVRESMTRIVGGFYVISDTHTYENGSHTMSLRISGDEGLPALDYEESTDDRTSNDAESYFSDEE